MTQMLKYGQENMGEIILNVKDIVAQNPEAEVWKLLHYFFHSDTCEKRIREIHQIESSSQQKNIAKQSKQIGYCIRQAEQYFVASNSVGLATRPVLVYYGMTSLSQAVVLMRGDGSNSFDKSRKTQSQNHHGLNIGGVHETLRSLGVVDILRTVNCEVNLSNQQSSSPVPWGQFPRFYNSLIPPAIAYQRQQHVEGRETTLNTPVAQACADIVEIDGWLGKKISLIELFANIPDLYNTLMDFGVGSNVIRGDLKETVFSKLVPVSRSKFAKAARPTKGEPQVEPKHLMVRDFFLNDLSANGKTRFNELFSQKNSEIKLVSEYGEGMHFRWTIELTDSSLNGKYFPDIVDSIANQKFYIAEPATYLVEPASYFAILYCLSMLARYHPDVWIGTLEANVQFSELMTSFLSAASRKVPLLLLDQLTAKKHLIHSS